MGVSGGTLPERTPQPPDGPRGTVHHFTGLFPATAADNKPVAGMRTPVGLVLFRRVRRWCWRDCGDGDRGRDFARTLFIGSREPIPWLWAVVVSAIMLIASPKYIDAGERGRIPMGNVIRAEPHAMFSLEYVIDIFHVAINHQWGIAFTYAKNATRLNREPNSKFLFGRKKSGLITLRSDAKIWIVETWYWFRTDEVCRWQKVKCWSVATIDKVNDNFALATENRRHIHRKRVRFQSQRGYIYECFLRFVQTGARYLPLLTRRPPEAGCEKH
jgi:hypothetical protein